MHLHVPFLYISNLNSFEYSNYFSMIKSKALHFSYNQQQKFTFPDLVCQQGEHCLILGQSGCGKTTLLHLLGGLLRPTKGSLMVGEQDIVQLDDNQLDAFRGKHIGIVFQQSHLIKALTVEENLKTAQYLSGNKQDLNKIKSILDQLNLAHKLHSKPTELSLGEQQRVAIARAVINNPLVILADEPTSSLDDSNCHEVVELLLNQSKEQQATLLIVTHDARLKERFDNQILLEASVVQ